MSWSKSLLGYLFYKDPVIHNVADLERIGTGYRMHWVSGAGFLDREGIMCRYIIASPSTIIDTKGIYDDYLHINCFSPPFAPIPTLINLEITFNGQEFYTAPDPLSYIYPPLLDFISMPFGSTTGNKLYIYILFRRKFCSYCYCNWN